MRTGMFVCDTAGQLHEDSRFLFSPLQRLGKSPFQLPGKFSSYIIYTSNMESKFNPYQIFGRG